MIEGLEARLDALGHRLLEWWAWPAALLGLGLAALLVPWLFVPGAEQSVTVLGRPAFWPCPVLVEQGLPCAQCGMTRSWVWAVRGAWGTALAYNPAGFALWLWLVLGGGLGAARLIRRQAGWARLGWPVLAVLALAWVGLYLVGWRLRLAGWLPLP